ncbi:MAG: Periplasmic pH-dependent serine endoprotease DegQ [Calditrichaeota bacterium]|nr:Periplasmic pH-dependent serine endoprotease DegQ [Calditrichota bacterium]
MSTRTFTSVRNGLIVIALAVLIGAGGYYVKDFFSPEGADSGRDSADQPRDLTRDESAETGPRADAEKPAPGDAPDDFDIGRDREREPLPVVGEFESPFVAVADRLKPSVVNLTVEGGMMEIPFHEDIPRRSGGSGVIVDQRGYVLTNNHVVQNAEQIEVTIAGGEERAGELLGADPESDLAVVDIGEVDASRVADLGDSDSVRIGDWAIAMGNPLGLDWTLTVGVISGKGRSDLRIAGGGPVFQDFIQTDASINFGNSGGPLANIHGEVVGINAATNASANGIGFAIPINMARDVVAQILNTGYVRRGYLGMVPTELGPLKKEALGLDNGVQGIFVESVAPNTPASEGGLADSDVVVEIDGSPVSDVTDFRMRVASHAPGERMALTVIRDGETKRLEFTLADRSEYVPTASEGRRAANGHWLGIEVTSLAGPEARELGVELERGVLVVSVDPESPAQGKLQPGDVIVRIGNSEIETLAEWRHLIEEMGAPRRAVLVKFYPEGREPGRFVALKP